MFHIYWLLLVHLLIPPLVYPKALGAFLLLPTGEGWVEGKIKTIIPASLREVELFSKPLFRESPRDYLDSSNAPIFFRSSRVMESVERLASTMSKS